MAKSSANKSAAQNRAAPGRPTAQRGSSRPMPSHSTGGSFTMTGANNGPGTNYVVPPAGSHAPAAAQPAAQPAAAPTVQPFLTPQQQAALSAWNVKYAAEMGTPGTPGTLDQADTNAWAKYNETYAADQLKNSQSVDTTNQAMGARGMFQSSIRDNALNDLAVTLAQQQNILGTNRDATLLKDQTTRTSLTGQNDIMQAEYGGLGVANAQAVTPVVGSQTASTGGVANPNQIVTQPNAAAPAGAAPIAHATAQPASSTPMPQAQAGQAGTVRAAKTRAGAGKATGARMTFGNTGGVGVRGSGGVGIP